ncbi:serine/threonine protein kinase [Modestobacter muralis]|uniref:Serine/threonine protein kinase n=1 Tax=Modestobacter muralis TaxID=1608614 RepID=A0A6P0EXM1_9ACTN|nr:serine/threonine protein kinase [Modestobacter muralis]NEK96442.1 serine/threonine protein kinase [Modestobacter muralis]NEN53342.1 serine/threonine protein kinase [Modestobacter muralis]
MTVAVPPDARSAQPATAADRTPAVVRARTERLVVQAAAVLAVAAPLVAALDVPLPGRTLLALLFVLAVPGVPAVSLLRVPNVLLAASLAGAVSIAVALLTTDAALVAGWWHPVGVAALTGAAGLALTVPALRRLPRTALPPRAGRGTATLRRRALPLTALAAALALWALATTTVDLDAAGGLGVVGVVGWPYLLSLALVAGVAARELLRPVLDGPLLALSAAVLTVVVFAFGNVADGAAGFSTGWLHVGFIDFITGNSASFTGLDARAYWPGFFAAGAQLVALAGMPDARSLLMLAPVFYDLAAIAPLLVVARCVTRSRRLAWLSVFVYLAFNWYQQDYFSPQATAFLLYLVTIAVLLWSATAAPHRPVTGSRRQRVLGAWRRSPELPAGVSARRVLAWEGALLLLAAAIVVSHQLTPITLALACLAFVLTGRTCARRLWLAVGLLFAVHFSYGATDYWIGHLGNVLGDLGRPGANFDTAVSARVAGDPLYLRMQNVRMGWSLVYLLAGVVGWWSIRRRREAPVVAALVAVAGSLVLFGSYGGEVVLRVFVFAAPLLAPLTALALRRLTRLRTRAGTAVLAAVLLLLGVGITATRGVNVAFERVTSSDVAAADALAGRLTDGDAIGMLTPTGAVFGIGVGRWSAVDLADPECGSSALRCAEQEQPRFVLLGRSQEAQVRLQGGEPTGWTQLADDLVRSGTYQVLYTGPDATALELTGTAGR